jgi:hypothetical protein
MRATVLREFMFGGRVVVSGEEIETTAGHARDLERNKLVAPLGKAIDTSEEAKGSEADPTETPPLTGGPTGAADALVSSDRGHPRRVKTSPKPAAARE